MDKLKKERKPLRAGFTRVGTLLTAELDKDELDSGKARELFCQLKDKYERLEEVQVRIQDLLLDDEDDPEAYEQDFNDGEGYRESFIAMSTRVNSLPVPIENLGDISNAGDSVSSHESVRENTVKVHKLNLEKKFDGNAKNWLDFWTQFRRVHEHTKVAVEDKFSCLIRNIKQDSPAASLVNSYPLSKENYPKVIQQLQDRFARPEVLVPIYVRELIGLIIQNASGGKTRKELPTLFDKIRAQLNALESLGKGIEQYGDFLEPLVESCLPEEVLRTWERVRSSKPEERVGGKKQSTLEHLLDFLQQEVRGELRISLAHSSFGLEKSIPTRKADQEKKKIPGSASTPTISALVNQDTADSEKACLFCGNGRHATKECYTARNIPVEEKREMLKKKGACFICLQVGHTAATCESRIRCISCTGRHQVVMCPGLVSNPKPQGPKKKRWQVSNNATEPTSTAGTSGTTASLTSQAYLSGVLLQTLTVKVEGSNGRISLARALIDTGAQRSYVCSSVVKRMGLKATGEETISHGLFGGRVSGPIRHKICKLYLAAIDGGYRCNFDVLEQDRICGEVPVLGNEVHLPRNVVLTEKTGHPREIEILIGADVAGQLFTGALENVKKGLVAMETRLGWTLMGKLHQERAVNEQTLTCLSLFVSQASVTDLWSLETLGIKDTPESKSKSDREVEALLQFHKTLKTLPDGRYQVQLPFREGEPQRDLPDNRDLAWKRNEATKLKLQRTGRLDQYGEVFDSWTSEGIIERVSSKNTNPEHYLPHRPVFKESSSTTKIRPVFDASAHTKGKLSLNDCLEQGPNLIELIPNLVDRFRWDEVGVVADIEKAFLQLEIEPSHRDYLRFFGTREDEVFRHCRVVFGVNASPFLLGAVIDFHLNQVPESERDVALKLASSFYVDNVVASVPDVEELQTFIEISKRIMDRGRFNLRCWDSNVNSCFTRAEDRDVSVLGLLWSLSQDTLRCDLSRVPQRLEVVSKRQILSTVQRVFDPIGVLGPVTIVPKVLLQELWSQKMGWDDPVPREQSERFESWRKQMTFLGEVRIPRHVGGGEGEAQLHVFVDASQQAYAACVFLRIQKESGEVTVSLLRAKNRVAPLQKTSIPRLELLACTIGVRLATSVRKALHAEEVPIVYWSDSMTSLWWIKHDGSWATFVRNRVLEIRESSKSEEWRHVPGILNPADLPSRGCTALKLLQSAWWEGPSWLKLSPHDWPRENELHSTPESELELRKTAVKTLIATEGEEWYLSRFSNYHRVLRLVAWVRRFVQLSRGNVQRGEITPPEIEEAEIFLFKRVQESIEDRLKKMASSVVQDDKGLWRMKTPLAYREDVYEFRYPVILPGQHPLIYRLIEFVHLKNCHAGPQILLGILRERYWILGARRVVRRVVGACGRCRRFSSKPLIGAPAVLPSDRVRDARVFEVAGVDCAGPVYLRGGQKAWILLVTCAVFRAVHLELITSMTTESFLQAFRRFVARRGRPSTVYSDNGTNFLGAANALRELDWEAIKRVTEVDRIVWKFNPPSAAWWGGWWERLIGITKDLLRKTLGRASLDYEEMSTVLCDAEGVVNSRPLTYLHEGEASEMVPLTPSLFLNDLQETGVPDIDDVDASSLGRRARHRWNISKLLRQRFRKEYLGQLKAACGGLGREVRPGEVVLIGDDNRKRLDWPIGRISEVLSGRDGHTRCVRVRTAKGEFLRPIQRVYSLEVKMSRDGGCPSCEPPAPADGSTGSSLAGKMSEDGGCPSCEPPAPVDHPVSPQDTELRPEQTDGAFAEAEGVVRPPYNELLKCVTRKGRLVKIPKILDLLNQAGFDF